MLEIGAGVGKLTGVLASLTSRLVVADISPLKLQLNQRNARAAGYADAIEAWVESDVVNLGEFRDGQFDAVVCYGGPLSYVFDQRERALRELLRVTRQDGLLFLSVRSLWGSIHKGFPSMLQHDPRFFREVVRTSDLGPDKVAVTGSFLHAYRAKEFRALLEGTGVCIEVLTASGVLSETWDALLAVETTDKAVWQEVIDLELQATRYSHVCRYAHDGGRRGSVNRKEHGPEDDIDDVQPHEVEGPESTQLPLAEPQDDPEHGAGDRLPGKVPQDQWARHIVRGDQGAATNGHQGIRDVAPHQRAPGRCRAPCSPRPRWRWCVRAGRRRPRGLSRR